MEDNPLACSSAQILLRNYWNWNANLRFCLAPGICVCLLTPLLHFPPLDALDPLYQRSRNAKFLYDSHSIWPICNGRFYRRFYIENYHHKTFSFFGSLVQHEDDRKRRSSSVRCGASRSCFATKWKIFWPCAVTSTNQHLSRNNLMMAGEPKWGSEMANAAKREKTTNWVQQQNCT